MTSPEVVIAGRMCSAADKFLVRRLRDFQVCCCGVSNEPVIKCYSDFKETKVLLNSTQQSRTFDSQIEVLLEFVKKIGP